ncbi:GntR family transcriptional regulator [Chitinibacter sp. S2-10]|uniref:GntR family transcriptional regulator n=1 Tax=Chitinibacter sp. S2-10 TaxID=3373597 RepID=UPI0039776C8C
MNTRTAEELIDLDQSLESAYDLNDLGELADLIPDPASEQPKLIQFFDRLRSAVIEGRWQPNAALPTIEEFAGFTGLQILEIQMAFCLLASQHWIRQAGNGLFYATPRLDQPIGKLSGFSEILRQRGFAPSSKWIERTITTPSLDEQWRLKLRTDEQIVRLQRLRMADGIVVGYEISSIPLRFLPQPELIEDSLYHYFKENDLNIDYACEEIDADYADEEMADWCQFDPAQPLLRLTRVSYLSDEIPLELSYSFFRSDYYHYVVQFRG